MEHIEDLPTDDTPGLLEREPVLVIVLGGTLIPTLIAAAIAFGVELSDEQVTAVLAVVGSISATVSAIAARARAWAPATVTRVVDGLE
jgi:hypothetical protein